MSDQSRRNAAIHFLKNIDLAPFRYKPMISTHEVKPPIQLVQTARLKLAMNFLCHNIQLTSFDDAGVGRVMFDKDAIRFESFPIRESEWRILMQSIVLRANRIFFSFNNSYVSSVSSIMPFISNVDMKRQAKDARKIQSSSSFFLQSLDESDDDSSDDDDERKGSLKGICYGDVLNSHDNDIYDHNFLDNSHLMSAKHHFLMSFPGVRFSVISYVKDSDLRSELNEQFSQLHPDVKITLSKIRRVKNDFLEIARELDLEIGTIALATVYFEKLIMKNLIEKSNRRLAAAVCLFLAFKFNEATKQALANFLSTTNRIFGVYPSHVLKSEFSVFVELGFNLDVDPNQLVPHFNYFLKKEEIEGLEEYLEPEMFRLYYNNVLQQFT